MTNQPGLRVASDPGRSGDQWAAQSKSPMGDHGIEDPASVELFARLVRDAVAQHQKRGEPIPPHVQSALNFIDSTDSTRDALSKYPIVGAGLVKDCLAVEFVPLFSGILPQDYRRISATARVKEFARGEMLYLEGDAVEQVYLLTSGFAKITQSGPRGTEVILRLGVPGDVLGAVSLFSTGSHCTTAQALRLGYALVWEARTFKPLVESLPILHQNMIRLTCGHLQELEERFRELATERVAPRVARQLVRLQEQIGRPANGLVEIGLSREDLAQMTGTTLFTVSRLLSAWEARGLVNPRRESVTICDVQLLRKISEET